MENEKCNFNNDYNFNLPEELIAKKPNLKRDNARLLLCKNNNTKDFYFYDLLNILEEGDLLVLNSSKVSQRRVFLKRETGGVIEAIFLKNFNINKITEFSNIWECLLSNKSKLKDGELLSLNKNNKIYNFKYLKNKYYIEKNISLVETSFSNLDEAEIFFENFGEMPIPPYFKRRQENFDKEYYQSVFAEKINLIENSAAAATAGLHFTQHLISKLKEKKIKIEFINLQIGYGTFAPLTTDNFLNNILHNEKYYISEKTAQTLNDYKKNKIGKVVAVGTTTLRALESNLRISFIDYNKSENNILDFSSNQNFKSNILEKNFYYKSGLFNTNIFLKPPDHIYSIDALITNFHLPNSSLLMLVACLCSKNYSIEEQRLNILTYYQTAIERNYNFYSYGDAMFIYNEAK